MKARTLFLFTIVMFILPLGILASDKEILKDIPPKTEESVQAEKIIQNQQAKSQLPGKESQEKALSLLLEEKLLYEAQRSFDRSLSNISTLIDIFTIVLTVLGVILAIAIALGIFEVVKWRGIRKDAEQARDEAKVAAQDAKDEVKSIRELKQRAEEELEKARAATPELVKVGVEKPTEDHIKKLDEFSRRLDLVEVLGIPLKAEDYLKRGNLLFDRNEVEKAIISYDKAIGLDPNNAYAWGNKGAALSTLKRYEEALSAFEKAIELDPNDTFAWSNKGDTLSRLERHEEALLACDKAIELDPENANAWGSKGFALGHLERYDEAISAYDKAAELRPIDAKAWNNKSNILIKLGRYDEAISACDKAIELDPRNAVSLYNRACGYSLKGEKEHFIHDLKRAIELDPKYRRLARKDDDFKSFRDDDEFKRIVE